jgi:predicted nucleic acid-binding protein
MKPDGDRGVQAWLDEQIAETLYVTSISVSELLLGIELLPDGKRKEGLAVALSDLLVTLFGDRDGRWSDRCHCRRTWINGGNAGYCPICGGWCAGSESVGAGGMR